LQEILEKSNMAAVVGEYVVLRPAGMGRLKGLCPFHGEKTASFNVDVEKGFFKCFGCGEGGNLFSFIMRAERLSFHEAVEHLARRAGVVLALDDAERRVLSERERSFDLMERAAEFYEGVLASSEGQPAREYLDRRGIDPQVAARFRLGWAPPGARLVGFLQSAGYSVQEASRLGLVRTDAGGRPVDYFRARVMFPISNAHGRPIALGGRLLGEGEPKYLNSPETPLFSKGRNLYGLAQARTAMARHDAAIVVEGYMDTIALHQHGFDHTVGTLGTALTEDQAHLVRRYTNRCILSYDGDQAGRKAAERGVPIFEAAGLQVRVLMLPDGEDPDTLAHKVGTERFAAMLADAPNVVDFLALTLMGRLPVDTPEGKSEFFRQMVPALLKIQDVIRRDQHVRHLCEKLGVQEELVRRAMRQSYGQSVNTRPVAVTPSAPLGAEESLVRHLLERPENLERARPRVHPDDLQNPELRAMYERLLAAQTYTAASIWGLFSEEGKASRVTELLAPRGSPPTTESLDSLLSHFERRRKERRLREVVTAIEEKINLGTMSTQDPLLAEKQALMRQLKGNEVRK
jgi:DNA primase